MVNYRFHPTDIVSVKKTTYIMKKILFLLSFCIISLGMFAGEKEVITDDDIFRAYIGESDVKPIFHALHAPIEWMTRYSRIQVAGDPYVPVALGREKAKKESKCTISATSSVVTICYKTAEVLACDFYDDSHSSNYGNPKRPDVTECKHGHHKVEAVMVLGDGSTYSGRADYNCTYSGYQIPRTHAKRGRNAAGQRVSSYGFGTSADPFAPWYVEHTLTQRIDFSTFAQNAGISTHDMIRRILRYGIFSFKAEGRDWGDGGIRNALFVAAGYKAKWDALEKKETSLGMADWSAARNEMKKMKPDFEKASHLFVSGSKHLKKAHKYDYSNIHEADTLFYNFTKPMYNFEAYDSAYMRRIVKAYETTLRLLEPPGSMTMRYPSQWASALIAKLWLDMRDYNPGFFETYNELYKMNTLLNTEIKNAMNVQYEVFWKRMITYASTNPEQTNQVIANYMNNPLLGDSCIDTLIIAKAKAEGALAIKKNENGEFDILHIFRNAPDSAMWHRSYSLSKDKSTRETFFRYYDVIVTDLGYIMGTLCDMVIQDKADIVSKICRSQLDSIMGSHGKEYQDRSELFNYYYNLYDQVSAFTKELAQCADNKDKAKARELYELAHNKFGITKRQMEEDYRMGHTDSLKHKTEAERAAIRMLLRNVRFQVYHCKKLTNFDPKKDILIIAETGNGPLENPTFILEFSKTASPIKEVYVDGQLVNIKPKKTKSKYCSELIYTYPGSLKPIGNNSFHCFVFKAKKAIKGLSYVPFHFNNQNPSIYYWLEAPNIESDLTTSWNGKVRDQTYIKLVFNE